MEKFHFFTQKVIPLVYDNSLSYYELLAKVVYKLNECIDNINGITSDTIINFIEAGGADEAINDRIDALAEDLTEQVADNTDALKDTLLKYDHFYKVTDLDGVSNDGTSNCYVGLRTLMDNLWQANEHAIVYFPSGVYKNETGVLPVPPNTVIIGDGESTVLYRSNVPAPETDTGFLCPAGDNIAIYNLKVQLNTESIPLQTGALAVGIGITNIAYPGLYPEFNVVRVPLRKNIVCDHIYSDGIYPLQAEVYHGSGTLENIEFKNGYYPNGIVSMYPWHGTGGETSPGSVGSKITNIVCKWLRVGGKDSLRPNRCMYAKGLIVSNCRAEFAWLQADGILCNGLLLDARNGLTLNGLPVNHAIEICGKVTLTNAHIIGGGSGRTYGILNRSLDTVMLTGVTIEGFTSGYLSQPWATADTPGTAMLANCDLGSGNSGVKGYGINTLANVPSTYRYFDFVKARYATLAPGDGVTFDAPTRTRINTFGPLAWLEISCSSIKPWLPANVITTIPEMFAPSEANTFGVMVGSDQNGNAINKPIAIGTNGNVTAWGSDNNITSWSGVIISIYPML